MRLGKALLRAMLAGLVLLTLVMTPVAARSFRLPRREPAEATPKPGNQDKIFPYGKIWVLQSVGGKPVGGDAPSFSLDERFRASGFGGCNTFSLTLYPIKGQKLAAGAVAMTRKTCDAATMQLERTVLFGLHSLPKWDLSADEILSIKGATGVLLFHRGV